MIFSEDKEFTSWAPIDGSRTFLHHPCFQGRFFSSTVYDLSPEKKEESGWVCTLEITEVRTSPRQWNYKKLIQQKGGNFWVRLVRPRTRPFLCKLLLAATHCCMATDATIRWLFLKLFFVNQDQPGSLLFHSPGAGELKAKVRRETLGTSLHWSKHRTC